MLLTALTWLWLAVDANAGDLSVRQAGVLLLDDPVAFDVSGLLAGDIVVIMLRESSQPTPQFFGWGEARSAGELRVYGTLNALDYGLVDGSVVNVAAMAWGTSRNSNVTDYIVHSSVDYDAGYADGELSCSLSSTAGDFQVEVLTSPPVKSELHSINDWGYGVGTLWEATFVNRLPFRANVLGLTALPLLVPGLPGGEVHDINNQGVMVGQSPFGVGLYDYHAVVWSADGGMTDLCPQSNEGSAAWSINERGQIAGAFSGDCDGTGGTGGGAIWENGQLTTVLDEGGGLDINDAGEVIVLGTGAYLTAEALIYRDGIYEHITPGQLSGVPTAINNRGEVVGYIDVYDTWGIH